MYWMYNLKESEAKFRPSYSEILSNNWFLISTSESCFENYTKLIYIEKLTVKCNKIVYYYYMHYFI